MSIFPEDEKSNMDGCKCGCRQHINVVLGVFCVVAVIAFCTVLGLYIKDKRRGIDTEGLRRTYYKAGHYDAGKRMCALNGLGQRCLNCFLINNDVECESNGCLWNVDVEDNFHLCYFQPSP